MVEEIITIPFRTPTINHLYFHRGNMKFLTNEAREIRKKIKKIVGDTTISLRKLSIVVEIYENWHCKNGDVKRVDLANREKFLIDSVFKALGVDDKFIFKQTMIKVQSDEEKAIIKIKDFEENGTKDTTG